MIDPAHITHETALALIALRDKHNARLSAEEVKALNDAIEIIHTFAPHPKMYDDGKRKGRWKT